MVEQFALLALSDDGKFQVDSTALEYSLAGAVLMELAELGRVDLAEDPGRRNRSRVVVLDTTIAGHPLLDEALSRLTQAGPVKPQRSLDLIKKGLKTRLTSGLVQSGLVTHRTHTVMGLFPAQRWPRTAISDVEPLRNAMAQALSGHTEPDSRTAGLIGLFTASNGIHLVVNPAAIGLSNRELRARAKHIRSQAWEANAVGKAIEAVQAAVIAAVTVSAIAAASSS